MNMRYISIIILCFAGAVTLSVVVTRLFFTPRIAYINNASIMVGFSEANKVEKELKMVEDTLMKNLQVLGDSVTFYMDLMTREYDDASIKRKHELQDLLAAGNERVNNYKYYIAKKMNEQREQKMKPVVEKINLFLNEYGKEKRYDMILGTTSNGNIVYGDTRQDITNEIVQGLNQRYK